MPTKFRGSNESGPPPAEMGTRITKEEASASRQQYSDILKSLEKDPVDYLLELPLYSTHTNETDEDGLRQKIELFKKDMELFNESKKRGDVEQLKVYADLLLEFIENGKRRIDNYLSGWKPGLESLEKRIKKATQSANVSYKDTERRKQALAKDKEYQHDLKEVEYYRERTTTFRRIRTALVNLEKILRYNLQEIK